MDESLSSTLYIVKGMGVTLQYTMISIILGLILGSILALLKLSPSKILNNISKVYLSIFRGTPLLVQLFIFYFAVPSLTNIKLTVFAAGVLAFSFNSAAYVSEIIRAGINSVDKGQFEAARALGVPKYKMLKDIIFPQALRNILPALVNEFVNLLKETAIISTIGGADLMKRAHSVAAEQYKFFAPLMTAAICYYLLVMLFSYFAQLLERKLNQKC